MTTLPVELTVPFIYALGVLIFLICSGFGVMWYLTGKGFENYEQSRKRKVEK